MKRDGIKVLVLTPIYPGDEILKTATPVVHYFVREWVKQGADVRVIHLPSNFPPFVNFIARPFKKLIASKSGHDVRTWNVEEKEYEIEKVRVAQIPLCKLKPHGRYSNKEINKAISKIQYYCSHRHYHPDVIVGHWGNPQLELLQSLKDYFKKPTCFVAHLEGKYLLSIYGEEAYSLVDDVDLIGYRSESIRRRFEANFHCANKPHFQCYSGIPSRYVEDIKRDIENRNTLLYVGTLIKRKNPVALVRAASKAYSDNTFKITYIGVGSELESIRKEATILGCRDRINLMGRIPRDEVVNQMDSHTIFVMISRNEAFGLVYLEAMARGCITIASRDEGFDGIIQHGVNGFLCGAGDVTELTNILNLIKTMPQEELQSICDKAVETAHELTDEKAAACYLNQLKELAFAAQ